MAHHAHEHGRHEHRRHAPHSHEPHTAAPQRAHGHTPHAHGLVGHEPTDHGRAFAVGVGLNTAFIVVETVCGVMSGSLALLADAGHNLSDVMGLLVAWAASRLSRRRPTERHTYGLRRSSILAALLNSLFLLVSIGAIVWEAVRRLREPTAVDGPTVMAVALAGVAINTATALLFRRGRHEDLNIRGAFLHMLADAAVSAGVVVTGLAIARTGLVILDPLTSMAIAAVILWGTWSLLREALDLALDAVPRGVDGEAVVAYLESLPAVTDVHHVHIWGLSTTNAALTAHLVLEQATAGQGLLEQIRRDLHEHYHIDHATIQLESTADAVCLMRHCALHGRRLDQVDRPVSEN